MKDDLDGWLQFGQDPHARQGLHQEVAVVVEEPAEIDHLLVDRERGLVRDGRGATASQRLPLATQESRLILGHVHEIVDERDAGRAAANFDALDIPLQL
jgi:hypothetical protein